MEKTLKATRDALGNALIELAKKDNRIYAFDCDLGRSTRSYSITEVSRDRFIEMGIAEQDMISTAAGLASTGKTVFVNTFAVFLTGRAYDQIRQQVALPKNNVKLCGSSAGLTQGPDGATHQSVTDVNLMRGLPNMMVIVPADARQAEEAIKFAASYNGPVYIRLSRYPTPAIIPEGQTFEPGKFQKINNGSDAAILGSGPVLYHCMEAAKKLQAEGKKVAVYNCPTIKPVDKDAVESLLSDYRTVFTVEENSIIGGLGSMISEIIAESSALSETRLCRIGVSDCFGESGTAEELLQKHGLDTEGIYKKVKEQIS